MTSPYLTRAREFFDGWEFNSETDDREEISKLAAAFEAFASQVRNETLIEASNALCALDLWATEDGGRALDAGVDAIRSLKSPG